MTKVAELYGLPTFQPADWPIVVTQQQCPFLNRKCLKNRKSARADDRHLHDDLWSESDSDHDLPVPSS